MSSRAHFRLTIETLAAAAICLAWHAAATAQSYDIRPNCNSSGSCYIRPGTYGYNDTWWRQWPTQYRPEVSDPRAVGAGRLPTPPGVPEAKLPAGGSLETKPPLGGEGSILPGVILPSGSGSTAPARQPHTEPGDRPQIAPSPDGALSIPGIPSTPNLFPGAGGPGPGTTTPKELPLPNLGEPDTGRPAPKSGEKEPAKNLDLEKPAAKPPEGVPLKPISFEQRDAGAKRSLHNALEGYCPVELREKEKWIAGHSDLRITYQGQVFRFSSEAAKKQFAAAPDKYAPANGGNDAVLAMEENRAVNGTIQHSAVWQGRLYLFASSANLAAFREDPTRYAKRQPPASEPNAIAAQRAPADSASLKRPPKVEEPQRLRLPGDSL